MSYLIHKLGIANSNNKLLTKQVEELQLWKEQATYTIERLRGNLKTVLDCYAGQVPTPGEIIEDAKDSIDWHRPTKDETEAFMKAWMKVRQEQGE